MSVRDIQVRLGGQVEDNILGRLGYREFTVSIGGTELTYPPAIKQMNLKAYSDSQLRGFADALGGQGNPIAYFEVRVSRLEPESLIRSFVYWVLTREGFQAECLPVDIRVNDDRYVVTLAVIKQNGVYS